MRFGPFPQSYDISESERRSRASADPERVLQNMNKSVKNFLIWLLVVCVAALVLCTVYYINHPDEADNGIVETMNELDSQ